MAQSSQEQRKALGAFLASRRARIQPHEAGLTAGVRRTPGLRREEVAVLAGVSVSWYTWIEQGRDIQPSLETVRRIARVLRLDAFETSHLLTLTGHAELSPAGTEHVSEGLKMLVDAMDPVATYVRNKRFDILAWNKAMTEVFVDYGILPPEERNTVRLMFLYPPYRSLILDWEKIAHGYVSCLRAERTKAIDKEPFDQLAAELVEKSPEFRTWWSEVEVKAFDEGFKRLRHPSLGEVEYFYVAMASERQPNLSVVTYLLQPSARDC